MAHRALAEDVTRRVHGGDGLAGAQGATDVLFGDFDGINDLDLAVLNEQGTRLTVFIDTGASWSSTTVSPSMRSTSSAWRRASSMTIASLFGKYW